jgi:uncharacterized protein YutE (UPF0331/DUF86 family)
MEILQKLKQLEENLSVLEEIKSETQIDQISRNKRYEWELRYGLFESIQIMVDVSCKVVNHFNLGHPKNYRECIELLGKFEYLDLSHVKRYMAMIGLRNLLIHEYTAIDIEKLYKFLDSLNDFENFIKEIKGSVL